MVFLPHTNTVILLEPYCGTITEPGLPVVKQIKQIRLAINLPVFNKMHWGINLPVSYKIHWGINLPVSNKIHWGVDLPVSYKIQWGIK